MNLHIWDIFDIRKNVVVLRVLRRETVPDDRPRVYHNRRRVNDCLASVKTTYWLCGVLKIESLHWSPANLSSFTLKTQNEVEHDKELFSQR